MAEHLNFRKLEGKSFQIFCIDKGSEKFLPASFFSVKHRMADAAEERLAVLDEYRKKMRELRELEARLKSNRVAVTDLVKEFNETEDALKALQSLGQIIGEVLKQLDDTRFIVKVLKCC